MIVTNQDSLAAKAREPFHHVLGIGHAAAEHEQLGLRRRQGDGEFVIKAAVRVTEHLILVDDEQHRAVALYEAVLLSFERGDDYGRTEIFSQVAGGDADIPAARTPFSEFVVRECAGGNGVNSLTAIFALLGPQLKDECLAGAGRGLDDHVLAGTQSRYCLLLPKVRDGDLVQGGGCGELFRDT